MRTTVSKLKPGDVLAYTKGKIVEISPVKGGAFDITVRWVRGLDRVVWSGAMAVRVERAGQAGTPAFRKPERSHSVKPLRIPRRGKTIRIRGVEHVIADIDRAERMIKVDGGKWFTFDEISK